MRVKFLRAHELRVSRMSKMHYDQGIETVIDDAIGRGLVADGIVVDMDAAPSGPAAAPVDLASAFTADQVAVLRAIADDVLARMAAEADAAATSGQPESEGATGEPIALADLSLEELRAIGVELEIKGAARMSKAKIIAAIEQMQADAADPVAVAAAAAEGTAAALAGGSGDGEAAS